VRVLEDVRGARCAVVQHRERGRHGTRVQVLAGAADPALLRHWMRVGGRGPS
jgi:hypothetical protein